MGPCLGELAAENTADDGKTLSKNEPFGFWKVDVGMQINIATR